MFSNVVATNSICEYPLTFNHSNDTLVEMNKHGNLSKEYCTETFESQLGDFYFIFQVIMLCSCVVLLIVYCFRIRALLNHNDNNLLNSLQLRQIKTPLWIYIIGAISLIKDIIQYTDSNGYGDRLSFSSWAILDDISSTSFTLIGCLVLLIWINCLSGISVEVEKVKAKYNSYVTRIIIPGSFQYIFMVFVQLSDPMNYLFWEGIKFLLGGFLTLLIQYIGILYINNMIMVLTGVSNNRNDGIISKLKQKKLLFIRVSSIAYAVLFLFGTLNILESDYHFYITIDNPYMDGLFFIIRILFFGLQLAVLMMFKSMGKKNIKKNKISSVSYDSKNSQVIEKQFPSK